MSQLFFYLVATAFGFVTSSEATTDFSLKSQEELKQKFEQALLCKGSIRSIGDICSQSVRIGLKSLGVSIVETSCKAVRKGEVPDDSPITFQIETPIELLGLMVNEVVHYPFNGGNHYVYIEVTGDLILQAKKMGANLVKDLWHPLRNLHGDIETKGPIYSTGKSGDSMVVFLGSKSNGLNKKFALGCVESQ